MSVGSAEDHIAAAGTKDRVVAGAAASEIVAGPECDRVRSAAGKDAIVTRARVDRVVSAAGVNQIATAATEQDIVAVAGLLGHGDQIDLSVPICRYDDVGRIADQNIVAGPAVDHVVARTADDNVMTIATAE